MPEKLKQDISIGTNLKKLRQNQGLTQEEVSIKLQLLGFENIYRETVSLWERGKFSIRISVLLALKEMYNASWEDFFQGLS